MRYHIIGEDYELWDIVTDGPLATTKKNAEGVDVPKTRADCTAKDLKKWEKNVKAKKWLICGLGLDDYNRIQSCTTSKEIWDTLQVAHEGTPQVKRLRGTLLYSQYENFTMKEGETIQEMMRDHIIGEDYELWDIVTDGPLATMKKNVEGVDVPKTRADCNTEDLKKWKKNAKAKKWLVCGLGPDEITLEEDKVEKILTRVLPVTWESKITAIKESKNIATLKLDELIGNLTAYELRRQTMKIDTPKNQRSLALRITEGADLEDDEMVMITRDFKKNKKKEQVQPKRNKGSTKAMVVAWEETSDDDLEDEAGDEQALMAIRESDDEQEVSVIHLKDKIKFLSKERLSELLLDFIDESEVINNEKEQLSRECVFLKAKCKNLESRANESDSKNAELKNQVLELDTSVLELRSEHLKLKLGACKKKVDHTHLTLEKI
ncbi:uncharacterized protein [Nicotiana sylvestris]|uniref:uncharacterized protein n=1 Tax=Nicotiana sylvestris TaxID=4096 RepID=UPI00388CE59E